MTGKKSSREKRRKRSGQEAAAALAAPDLVPVVGGTAGSCGSGGCCGGTGGGGGSGGGGGGGGGGASVAGGAERSERRKRRSTDSSSSVSGSVQQETKCLLPTLEKELLTEHSDVEEGGLDLTVSLKPVSFYISDKKEMLQQCFCIIGEKKLQKMLPDVLKNCSVEEIKKLCQEQLELLSEKKILKILEGDNGLDSDMEEEADDGCKVASDLISQQDTCVDSASSLRENKQPEGLESKQGKGEDSDVLSINADAYDSDIEGPCNEEAAAAATAATATAPEAPENTVQSEAAQIDDLEKDIEKSVNEILGLAESSPKELKAATLTVPPPEDVQPSAQQLELLELEMRARAIKALMKAGDLKKPV
ncbi:caspase activity and apoptosis inhibitor 1 [Alexandromys fortis]|uniref:caspase activity and apoptosis inhibitor 1 n=1 Tax=Alexandromys fortis TaxID=100897 RepID=UPI0021537B2F|nr:caspase activity and apoptosis inhibitor 1 [Microtus fortis]